MISDLAFDGGQLAVEIFGREFPDSRDYWDANWLNVQVRAGLQGFDVDVPLTLRNTELEHFHCQMRRLLAGEESRAEFKTLEDGLTVVLIGTKTGRIEGQVRIQFPIGGGATLEFVCESDIASVQRFADGLGRDLSRYPVVGTAKPSTES